MFDWLDKLRERPEHVRFRFALTSAGIITALIFFVWLSIISLGFDGGGTVAEKTPSGPSPLSAIGAFFTDTKQLISEEIEGLGTIEYEASKDE